MIVSIHQPAYLPWLGYFARIAASDVFVVLDTVQFERNSFTNRNRIKTPQGPMLLTVPILTKGHLRKNLLDMEIDERSNWRIKHHRSIEQNYCKAAHFAACQEALSQLMSNPSSRLVDLCLDQLSFWMAALDIRTKIVRASALPVSSTKAELVLDICRHLKADLYLSGPMGRDYLDEGRFRVSGVSLQYFEYRHPEYRQLYGVFEPYLSVVDYWMNCGDTQLFRQPV